MTDALTPRGGSDPDPRAKPGPGPAAPPVVGDFSPGSPASRWALTGYLVGQALAEATSRALYLVAALFLGLAALAYWGVHSPASAAAAAFLALCVLALRALLRAVLHRLTLPGRGGRPDRRLAALVKDTRRDVLAELRRLDLPGRTVTLPLLALRLMRRSTRAATTSRLRAFEVDRVVPRGRVDELHLLLGVRPGGGPAAGSPGSAGPGRPA